MGLNKSTGEMYTWVTHTWNTIKGECQHGCTYCYMKQWGTQKPVRFDTKELKTSLGKGNTIFVGSSCDVFAQDIPDGWITRTLEHCRNFDNTYLFQTKNPRRILEYEDQLPEKSRICTTIETNRWYPEIMGSCPRPEERSGWLARIGSRFPVYITAEPIMDFDIDSFLFMLQFPKPQQINLGADSKNNHLPEPSREKLQELIAEIKKITTIDEKRNLKRLL